MVLVCGNKHYFIKRKKNKHLHIVTASTHDSLENINILLQREQMYAFFGPLNNHISKFIYTHTPVVTKKKAD